MKWKTKLGKCIGALEDKWDNKINYHIRRSVSRKCFRLFLLFILEPLAYVAFSLLFLSSKKSQHIFYTHSFAFHSNLKKANLAHGGEMLCCWFGNIGRNVLQGNLNISFQSYWFRLLLQQISLTICDIQRTCLMPFKVQNLEKSPLVKLPALDNHMWNSMCSECTIQHLSRHWRWYHMSFYVFTVSINNYQNPLSSIGPA